MSKNKNIAIPELSVESSALYEEPNYTGSPERNLLLAILERALLDYVGNEKKQAELAKDWLFNNCQTNNNGEPSFSFRYICEALDLDHQRVTEVVRQMPKRGNKKIAPWYFTKHEESYQAA